MLPTVLTRQVEPVRFTAGLMLSAILMIAPASTFAQPAAKGEWGPVIKWPNVGIHVHVLPNGKVMFWGRREWAFMNPDLPDEGLDPHDCTPRLWAQEWSPPSGVVPGIEG
jgi:hypothetical protein